MHRSCICLLIHFRPFSPKKLRWNCWFFFILEPLKKHLAYQPALYKMTLHEFCTWSLVVNLEPHEKNQTMPCLLAVFGSHFREHSRSCSLSARPNGRHVIACYRALCCCLPYRYVSCSPYIISTPMHICTWCQVVRKLKVFGKSLCYERHSWVSKKPVEGKLLT